MTVLLPQHYGFVCGVYVQTWLNMDRDWETEYDYLWVKDVVDREDEFVNCMRDSLSYFKTNSVIMLFGDDFSFLKAR